MAELIIRSGKHQGKKLVLPAVRVLIGRDQACHIRLASDDVSRQHCSLRVSPDGIYARDLGSRNGTLVNDVAIVHETLLQPGDLLQVGPMVFEVPRSKTATPHAAAPTGQTAAGQAATDDDIASWLSDEDAIAGTDPGDTTIISTKPTRKEPAPPAQSPARKQFKSVADEAADIIRRHREREAKLRAEQEPKRQQERQQEQQQNP